MATKSEGLLLRPAQAVKLAAADAAKLETVGEQETSLWSVLPIGAGKFVASDYKGGLYLYGDGDAKKFECDARWIRATAKAPGDAEILAGTEDGKLVVLSIADKKEARRIDAQAAASSTSLSITKVTKSQRPRAMAPLRYSVGQA